MFSLTQTRAEARALIGAVFVGAALGVAVGGAYMAGGIARDQGQHARIERLAGAAASGFSDSALRQTAAAMPPGVLAAARRHDPFTVAGGAERDRQAALLAARLERPAAPVAGRIGPAAEPFRLTGALEQSRDLDCLSSAVYYEARGESAAGQAAVAQVVLNRVRHPAFPKTVCGVVFQGVANGGCQFSFACNGAMRRGKEPAAWARARDVAAKALGGHVMAEVGEAVNFHVASLGSVWGGSMRRVGQVGSHVFYAFGGHGGSPGAFHGGAYAAVARPDAAETVDRPIYAASPGAPTADGVPTAQLASAIVTIAPQPTAAKDVPATPEAKPPAAKPSDSAAKPPSPTSTSAAS